MVNKSIANIFSEIISLLKLYVVDYLELLTLNFVDKLSALTAKFIYLFWIIFFFALTLVFCMFGLTFYMSSLLGSYTYGFFAMAGLNLLIVLFFMFKPARGKGSYKWLIKFLSIVTERNFNESKEP